MRRTSTLIDVAAMAIPLALVTGAVVIVSLATACMPLSRHVAMRALLRQLTSVVAALRGQD